MMNLSLIYKLKNGVEKCRNQLDRVGVNAVKYLWYFKLAVG